MRAPILLALAILLSGCFVPEEARDEGSRVPGEVTPGESEEGRVVSLEWVFENQMDEKAYFAATLSVGGELAVDVAQRACPFSTTEVAPGDVVRVQCQYELDEGQDPAEAEASVSWRRSIDGEEEDTERVPLQLQPHQHAAITATLAPDGDLSLRAEQASGTPPQ